MTSEYEYLGDFSATPPWRSQNTEDGNDCPVCGEDHEGNVPSPCQTGDGL